MKFTKKYCNQMLFLFAIIVVGILLSNFFVLRENLTSKTNCPCNNIPMHWGWPTKKPPAPMIYGF